MKKNLAMINKTEDIKLAELNKQFILPDQTPEMSKILIKSWKASQEYQKLMKTTDKNSGKTTDLSQKYQAQYLKFVKNLLGEKLTESKGTTAPTKHLRNERKSEKVLHSNASPQIKKVNQVPLPLINNSSSETNAFMFNEKIKLSAKNKGLSKTQLELLKSRKNGKKQLSLSNLKNLNAETSNENVQKKDSLSSRVADQPHTNFFDEMLANNDNTSLENKELVSFNERIKLKSKTFGLNKTQLELLKKRNNDVKNTSSGYPQRSKTLTSGENSQKDASLPSPFNEQPTTNFFDEMLANEDNAISENKEIVSFNERIKLKSKTFGLSKTQVELLKRRDSVKPQYNNDRLAKTGVKTNLEVETHQEQESLNKINVINQNFKLSPGQLKLIAGRDLTPQQWKEFIGSSQKKGAEPAPRRKRVTTQEILAKQKQISGAAFKNTLGKKRIFDGKVISNYIAESTAIKTVIKSNPNNTELDNNKLLEIKSLVISNEEKLKKEQQTMAMASSISDDIKAEPKITLGKENKVIEEKYVSIIDPKKRPNLKKLKYGETFNNASKDNEQNDIKQVGKRSLRKTKKSSKNIDNEESFAPKELPDYQIDYFNLEKRPDLDKDLTRNIYTYEGYHPKEIREIERQYLKEVNEQQQKEKLIAKNLKKTARQQKHLKNKYVKPQPLPKILIDKYQKEGKKVINGMLIDESKPKK
ncbi:hypothetical protein SSYRP_v1c05820 [Spiroplasma syrphidicola EA-1]|uniref:Uncharacterized protein n=1 Tax=Spiroplasma syrphidicola EA-1 TaxID=1276229 RepID=R4U417_9MOLU|nr:hypothetical protein [Spiroplasma syrphidicola]AGM26172.1 hypothetical protein SSYRP_v1c05820 [Spiroplasma syrphidicola EA-1]